MNENDWEWQERVAIRHTMSLYHAGSDSGDYDRLGLAYAPDGAMAGGKPLVRTVGREAIVARLDQAADERGRQGRDGRFQRHHLSTSIVEFDSPTEASGTSYFLVLTEAGPDHAGVYTDRFVKIEGKWFIQERQIALEWIRAGSRYAYKH